MPIISLDFALFVLISLVIFYLLPGRFQNIYLLLASLYYYSTWSWGFVVVIIALTAFNYLYAPLVPRSRSSPNYIHRIGIVINLAIIAFFMFGDFFGIGYQALLEQYGRGDIEVVLLMPLGISYYTLECVSYLIDNRLKIIKPADSFIDFALYLAYFPKLISGPIERAKIFLPQLSAEQIVNNPLITRSLLLILLGLFQSVVLAGLLTAFSPSPVIHNPQSYSAPELLLGLLASGVFLYNQFAGYTKLVRGISGLFGIELSRNFAYPFFSKDFSDLWNRWHISLSQWLRDYIYLPLSRTLLRRNPSRSNKANLVLPPLSTMLASGLWHGASMSLILWGALNGLYIILENFFNLYRPTTPGAKPPAWRRVSSSLTVIGLSFFAFIPFQLDLQTSKVFFYQLLFAWEMQLPDLRPLLVIFATLLIDWYMFRNKDEAVFLKWPRTLQILTSSLVLISIIIVNHLENAPPMFIYP
jgi:D-alanyl-lipoteichoic acid acyltransferase DltB (MBOAT superfamily)